MNNYVDIRGRLHDKPVTTANQFPCNNANLYSAYGAKAGVDLNLDKETLVICAVDKVRHRVADKKTEVPMSRDEILGLAYFGYVSLTNWKFNPKDKPIPKFSLIKLVKQLWELRPTFEYSVTVNTENNTSANNYFKFKHRNYFWKNNLDQLYRFAFSVPLSDRHFILKKWGKFRYYNPIHLFYAAFGKINSKISPSGLDWLKYHEKRGLEAIKQEFPEDHPIRRNLGL